MRLPGFPLVLKLLILLLSAAVAGCSPVWSAISRPSLEADVGEVLARGLQDPPGMECRMIGTTRSGYCTLELDGAGALAVAEGLSLESGNVDLQDPAGIPPAAAEGIVGYFSPEVMGSLDGLPAYWIGGRPDSLRLQNGGQFEYMVLILGPDTRQACVQVSYAYG
ncbi:MAG: hypothetical protein NTU91_15250 [Chloroflexi bacterium]|jgi:hypothetical protein|nr:hypothetical protein [Chloroflexota bacterium]